jgi:nitroreductase
MELKEAIGRRRSMRFLAPYRPVEREKIQKMLEAARQCSFWGNVRALRATVIEKASAPQEILDAIPEGSALGGFQLRLAPVIIIWWVDWHALKVQGDRLHELVDAGAAGIDKADSHRYLDEKLIPFFAAAGDALKTGGMTEMDCGQGIAHATLVAFEEGLGTCLLGLPAHKKLKKALKLPEDSKLLCVQTVGYPAEQPEAGGQRPRLPFEEMFSLNVTGHAFPRDAKVVEELERAKLIQAPAPLPWRFEELKYLAKALDIAPIFGEESEGIVIAMMQEMQEEMDKRGKP